MISAWTRSFCFSLSILVVAQLCEWWQVVSYSRASTSLCWGWRIGCRKVSRQSSLVTGLTDSPILNFRLSTPLASAPPPWEYHHETTTLDCSRSYDRGEYIGRIWVFLRRISLFAFCRSSNQFSIGAVAWREAVCLDQKSAGHSDWSWPTKSGRLSEQ